MPPKLKKTSPRPKLNELINIIKQTKQQPSQIKSIDYVSKSEKKRRVNGLFDCLWVLSGGCELSFILNLLLKQRRIKTTLNNLTGLIQPKYDSIINTIQHAHQQAPNHNQKRQLLSLVSDSIPFQQLKGMGFQINRRNFVVAKRHSKVFGPGQPVPKQSQPIRKRKMSRDHETLFCDFLNNHSHEAANRTVKGTPVRYVESKS